MEFTAYSNITHFIEQSRWPPTPTRRFYSYLQQKVMEKVSKSHYVIRSLAQMLVKQQLEAVAGKSHHEQKKLSEAYHVPHLEQAFLPGLKEDKIEDVGARSLWKSSSIKQESADVVVVHRESKPDAEKGSCMAVSRLMCALTGGTQGTVGAHQKMASAKFLEEALSTNVDESAVNAIVGSLETQLVTSQQGNGDIVSDANKRPGSGFMNQVTSNLIKSHEPVKIVYSSGSQTINCGVTFQPGRLPNGNLGLATVSQSQAGSTKPAAVIPATSAMVTASKPVLPMNVQLINVRAGNNMPSRVVIGQPGQLTLQTVASLQGGTQGHILVRTENGQLQLLKVGPPPPTTTTAMTTAVVPTVFQPIVASTATTTLVSQNGTIQQRQPVGTTKEKCRKFLANLLELSNRESEAVERNVRSLIQELIDMKLEPEEFCNRLERLLNASPQPCLIGFLKKSLPLLRQALYNKEMAIDGIRPPPPQTVVMLPNAAAVLPTPPRPSVAMAQVRLNTMTPSTVPRPPQMLQTHKLIVPVRVQAPSARMIQPPSPLPTPSTQNNVITTMPPTQMYSKINMASQSKTTVSIKPTTPSLLPKPIVKAKEKKSYSSVGDTGDDDINDVAAMGGVNLAEETQTILGSTEFVGTQIRSCKDEIYLHTMPLQHKIKQIAAKHGLDEPSIEVASLISHACQERLKTLIQKLAMIGAHKIDALKMDPCFEVENDVKAQLKFLEELDQLERKRHEDHERELLLRAAKIRSKSEDPEQVILKARAKEMQRTVMEEIRQQETNLTALQAIGPRKKPKLELGQGDSNVNSENIYIKHFSVQSRLRRVTIQDLLCILEKERELCGSTLLYKSYLR